MNPIIFTVNTKPHGKCRPRFGKGKVYKTESDRQYEKTVAVAYRQAAVGVHPYEGAVQMKVTAIYKAPESWSKRKKAEAEQGIPKLSKPDGDNIIKAVKDALNGIAYIDDAQVYDERTEKYWGCEDKVIVVIERK